MRLHFSPVLLALALAACASSSGSPSPHQAVSALAPPARDYRPSPTGVILLKEGDALNSTVCSAFLVSMPWERQVADLETNVARAYWLVDSSNVPNECDAMIARYDYARATIIANSLNLSDGRLPAYVMFTGDAATPSLAISAQGKSEQEVMEITARWVRALETGGASEAGSDETHSEESSENAAPEKKPMWQKLACTLLRLGGVLFGADGREVATTIAEDWCKAEPDSADAAAN